MAENIYIVMGRVDRNDNHYVLAAKSRKEEALKFAQEYIETRWPTPDTRKVTQEGELFTIVDTTQNRASYDIYVVEVDLDGDRHIGRALRTAQLFFELDNMRGKSTQKLKKPSDKRVVFDFEVDFTNGGGIQGQDFRLDIDEDDISDGELAEYLIKEMRLLMVKNVRIKNKRIITEPHKRPSAT
jgi:hypothetical protein